MRSLMLLAMSCSLIMINYNHSGLPPGFISLGHGNVVEYTFSYQIFVHK